MWLGWTKNGIRVTLLVNLKRLWCKNAKIGLSFFWNIPVSNIKVQDYFLTAEHSSLRKKYDCFDCSKEGLGFLI